MHWGNQTIFSVHAHTASLVRTRGTMYGGFGSRFGLIGFEEIECAETCNVNDNVASQVSKSMSM